MNTPYRSGFNRKTHTAAGKAFMWENGKAVSNREIYKQFKEAFEIFQAKRRRVPRSSKTHEGWTYSPRNHEKHTH